MGGDPFVPCQFTGRAPPVPVYLVDMGRGDLPGKERVRLVRGQCGPGVTRRDQTGVKAGTDGRWKARGDGGCRSLKDLTATRENRRQTLLDERMV